MQVLCGIHTLIRTPLPLNEYKTMVLAGFVAADYRTYKWSKSSEECCTELSWPSLSTRRKYLSLTIIYDILHHHISLKFSDYFTFSSAASTRSHSLSILCKQSSINSYRYSFFVNSVFWWNSIPFDILSTTRRTTFRRMLYNILFVSD